MTSAIFGDFSPAGRLPITLYWSVDQLPSFSDHAMKNRTARYLSGDPLYRFGYGLSYTTFHYGGLKAPSRVAAGQSVTVTANVRNAGDRESDEVAELYLRPAPDRPESERRFTADQPMPRIVLGGFHRLHLKPGESAPVTFTLTAEQLLLVREAGGRDLQPGTPGRSTSTATSPTSSTLGPTSLRRALL